MNYQRLPTGQFATETTEAFGQPEPDEISLADLVKTLWRSRGLLVLFPLVGMLVAGLTTIGFALRTTSPTIYYVALKGIEQGLFPNGTAFSPQDLTGSAILGALSERYEIPQDAQLREAISVDFGNPVTPGLTKAYHARLKANGLSSAEITQINENYETQLRDATQSMLRVEVNHDLLGLDPAKGKLIARAIPEIWSSYFSQNVRIFEDTGLAEAAITSRFEDLRSTASILEAKQRLQAMDAGLQILSNDNRLSLLKTSDGHSVEDLRQALSRFQTVYFSTIMFAGLQDDGGVGSAYVAELQLRLQNLRRKLASFDDSLRQVHAFQTARTRSFSGEDNGADQADDIRFSENGLTQVVQLAERASFADFVQETLRGKQEVAYQISDLEQEIDQAAFQQDAPSSDIRQPAAQLLDELTQRYSELLEIARTRMRGRIGKLYQPVAEPMEVGAAVSKRSVLTIIFAAGLGLLLAIGIVLLRASVRSAFSRSEAS